MARKPQKNLHAIEPVVQRRWVRNGELAKYLGVSKMYVWRLKHDPSHNFPPAAKINGIEFNDLAQVDLWLQARISP